MNERASKYRPLLMLPHSHRPIRNCGKDARRSLSDTAPDTLEMSLHAQQHNE